MMLESTLEKRLKREVEKSVLGAVCMKWVCPGYSGVPDRIILLPGGKIVFVELKAPGKHERVRQEYVQARLRKLGFIVFSSVDSPKKIDAVVRYCKFVSDRCVHESDGCVHEWVNVGAEQTPDNLYTVFRCRKCKVEKKVGFFDVLKC